jgi:hypothetical protein
MSTDQREKQKLELHGGAYFPHSIGVSFWVCTAIAVVVVLRRLYALSHPPSSAPPPLLARCLLRITCAADVGTHSSGISPCRISALGRFPCLPQNSVARASPAPLGWRARNYSLRDERRCFRRMGWSAPLSCSLIPSFCSLWFAPTRTCGLAKWFCNDGGCCELSRFCWVSPPRVW